MTKILNIKYSISQFKKYVYICGYSGLSKHAICRLSAWDGQTDGQGGPEQGMIHACHDHKLFEHCLVENI